jgi:hypothetical protein
VRLKALSRFVDVGVVSGGSNVNVMDGVVMVVDGGRAAGEEEIREADIRRFIRSPRLRLPASFGE